MTRLATLLLFCLAVILIGCGTEPAPGAASASASARASSVASAPTASAPTSAAAPVGSAPAVRTVSALPAGAPLKIGVTLHPYYSWVKNIVGDAKDVEVRPILPGDVDAGDYQPRPDDIKKLSDLNAIVVNGIGHDDFIKDMIKASGNDKLHMIRVNEGIPLLKGAHGEPANSHTFISFTNAIQQTYVISAQLSAMRPDLADTFQKNSTEYAKKLRAIKTAAATQLAKAKVKRVVTVHDGYGYLCQEFGLEVATVVQPAHGLVPSAEELGNVVDLLKKEKLTVVLSEESFPDKLLNILKEAGPVKVYVITHVASGEYTADKFEKEMQKNADTLVEALVTDP